MRAVVFFLLVLMPVFGSPLAASAGEPGRQAKEYSRIPGQAETEKVAAAGSQDPEFGGGDAADRLIDELDLADMERSLDDILQTEDFSFRDAVLSLARGEVPFSKKEILRIVSETLLNEVRQQRKLMLQILFVVLAAAVFSNFTMVFHSSQIADISFYIMFLLLSVILMKSFRLMNGIARDTILALVSLMRVLLPAYLLTIIFCAGSLTTTGISEILLFAFSMMEVFMVNVMIPAVTFYLVLQILNKMVKEDYFSKFAELIELVVNWGVKSVFGIVIGLQTVQCLIMPAVDALKSGMLRKAARAIPGIGNTLDAAAETIAGSAVVIKNAVGTAGMAAILFLCLVPVAKLLCCVLMLRMLCALVQPVGEARLVESISHVASATSMLLRIVLYSTGIFMVSVAMIMAGVKG